ncbi:MAG: SDR family oxidoreductase [Verrucomicrobiaceae bacterium]|nr:MAG: SDR family oxidoreductase [Verrucomicrobiaceae bacterium]
MAIHPTANPCAEPDCSQRHPKCKGTTMMKKNLALVTGCTSGIGLHLAREFASHGHDLVLIAPVEQELDELAIELGATYGARCHIIAKDLERESSAEEIQAVLIEKGLEIDILANNAGHGFRGEFWASDIARDMSMINLNISAVVRLTKLILPTMLTRGSGFILNTASVAGFEPGPLLAVYHATKAFVLSWSEALAMEVRDSGVTVTALCPGATDTDFFSKAGMQDVVAFQKGYVMAPQNVAKAAYEGLMSGELFVIPGMPNKLLVAARRVLSDEAQAKLNRKQYERVPAGEAKRQRGQVEAQEATV